MVNSRLLLVEEPSVHRRPELFLNSLAVKVQKKNTSGGYEYFFIIIFFILSFFGGCACDKN